MKNQKIIALLLALSLVFAAFAVFPALAVGTTVTVNALYGKIENYHTAFGWRTYFIIGFSSDADTLVKAIKNDSYLFEFTVKDETTGVSKTFEYHSRSDSEYYDTDSWDFARIPVCEYGVYPQPDHAYTLSFTARSGGVRAYGGSSAVGAFVSTNEDFLANGPIVPDLSGVTVDENSPLKGKSILFVGDSITEAICEVNIPEKAYTAGWPGRVGVSNGAYYMNLGRSGATISNKNGSNQVLNQLTSMKDRSFDLVILHGGVNDAWFEAPLGEITAANVRAEGSFDLTTFAGGLEETFRYARTTFPTAKFGYIINHTMPQSVQGTTADMHDLFELAKAICDKWGVPYLDLYNNEELNVNRMKTDTAFTLADGYKAHPNDRGYDILFPYVDAFVKAVWAGTDPALIGDPPYTPPTVYTVTGETNAAFGKAAKTSSGANAPAATDGKINAYVALGDWAESARGPAYGTDGTCYLEVDLGAVYDLDKINVVNYVGNLLYKWDAFVTTDNQKEIGEWTRVGGKTTNEMSYEDGYTISFEPIAARYLRIYGMGHTGTAWVLNEVSAYGTLNEQATLGDAVLQSAAVSATLPDGSAANKLTDGNKTSDPAQTGAVYGGSVTVDLGSVKALSSVAVYTYENNSEYTLLGSNDGAAFETIGQKPLGAATYTAENGHEYIFEVSGSYRYLKVLWAQSERGDGYVALAELIAYDGGGNALTASSATAESAVNGGSNAIDGSKTSYVFLKAPQGGFILDLGASERVRKIAVYPVDPSRAFTVSCSSSKSSFTSFAAYDPSGGTASPVILFGDVQCRYIRISPVLSNGVGFDLYEVEVWTQEEDPGDTPDPQTLPNASLGKPAVLYTGTNYDKDYLSIVSAPGVTDGKMNDVWAYGAFGAIYAQIDLEVEYQISAVNVRTYYNDAYGPLNHAWSVWISIDGENFTKTAEVPKTGHPAEGVTVSFDTVAARYVRVVADFYVTAKQFSFNEVTVYGVVPKVPLEKASVQTVTLPDGGAADALTNGVYDDTQHISGASGGHVTLDLGGVSPVDRIAVYTYENNSAYTVYGSSDNSAWTFLGFKALDSVSNTANGWEYILDVSGSYRYIRVQWAQSARSDGYLTIKEIDISNGGTEYTDVTIVNTKIVYQNNNSDDGNYGNYTFYKKADGSVLVDLGEVKDVRKIELFSTVYAPALVFRSADGENYTAFGAAFEWKNGKATLEADYSATRYLKITGLLGDTVDLAEIAVYTPADALKGDLDLSGAVDIGDVTLLLNYLAGGTAPAAGAEAADLDSSGVVDIGDVSALLDQLAG